MLRPRTDLLIFCKQVGFGEFWHRHSCQGWQLKISDDVFQWQHGNFLLLKVAFGEICLIIGISQESVLFLISQSSTVLLSLKDHLFATSRDCIFWNSSSAFSMKMPASSSETQKHDAMHVFIYSLCAQHVQHAIYLYLMEKEGKAPQTVMLTGCCCETRIVAHSRTCYKMYFSRREGGDDTGREESGLWELDMRCFCPSAFSTYEHVGNICFGNHQPHVEDCYNCFSKMIHSESAFFGDIKGVEYPQENREPICANYQGKCGRTDDPVDRRHVTELSNVIPLGAAGLRGRCLHLITLEKCSAHPLQK